MKEFLFVVLLLGICQLVVLLIGAYIVAQLRLDERIPAFVARCVSLWTQTSLQTRTRGTSSLHWRDPAFASTVAVATVVLTVMVTNTRLTAERRAAKVSSMAQVDEFQMRRA